MPTDPAILAQLQTLWGEPVTETTAEADSQAAFVPSEWQPSPIRPTRPADAPASWDASTVELIGWFQNAGDRLPVEPFDLCSGCRVVEPARFYAALRTEIATGPTGPRARLGTLQVDLRRLRDIVRRDNETG